MIVQFHFDRAMFEEIITEKATNMASQESSKTMARRRWQLTRKTQK